MTTKTKGWPPSRRKAQAERIRRLKPWRQSTGPRTAKGRARVARNALKHGLRSRAAARIRAFLRRQAAFLRALNAALDRAAAPSAISPAMPAPGLWTESHENGFRFAGGVLQSPL